MGVMGLWMISSSPDGEGGEAPRQRDASKVKTLEGTGDCISSWAGSGLHSFGSGEKRVEGHPALQGANG